jgi:hypothetical protein
VRERSAAPRRGERSGSRRSAHLQEPEIIVVLSQTVAATPRLRRRFFGARTRPHAPAALARPARNSRRRAPYIEHEHNETATPARAAGSYRAPVSPRHHALLRLGPARPRTLVDSPRANPSRCSRLRRSAPPQIPEV